MHVVQAPILGAVATCISGANSQLLSLSQIAPLMHVAIAPSMGGGLNSQPLSLESNSTTNACGQAPSMGGLELTTLEFRVK